jgi:hypothetical protein
MMIFVNNKTFTNIKGNVIQFTKLWKYTENHSTFWRCSVYLEWPSSFLNLIYLVVIFNTLYVQMPKIFLIVQKKLIQKFVSYTF